MRGPRLRGETMSATRPYSSPPVVLQRKLTLNDFPMEYGVKDALQRSVTSRQERSRLQDRLQSARKESETLREYSRRRFQTVVDWEARPSPQPVTVPKIQPSARPKTTTGARPLSLTHPLSTPTNGPTKDGSILYNGKPFLLSSLRTRPSSEPPSRFDHLRGAHGKAYPYIQKTLEQSNCEYRVGASPCHTAREDRAREGGLSPDFVMLIPVTSPVSDVTSRGGRRDADEEDEAGSLGFETGQAWAEAEGPLLVSTARSRSPGSEERSEGRLELGARGVKERQGHHDCFGDSQMNGFQSPSTGNQPAGATTHSHAALPNSAATTTTTPPSPPPPSSPPPSPPPPPSRQTLSPKEADPRSITKTVSPTPPLSTAIPDRPPNSSSSSRSHSAMSATSTMSSVSITPRPHCWVDDVTVSSDTSLIERDLSLQQDPLGGDDRMSIHSQDHASRAQLPSGMTPGQLPRLGSPSGTEKNKKSLLSVKRVTSPQLLKRAPSGGKTKTGAGAGGGGGCPRSLKHSSASGSKAGGGVKTGEGDRVGLAREGELVVGDGEEEMVLLPRFMCPSSESKSRQAAIKEWLAKTSFASACRTVPLT